MRSDASAPHVRPFRARGLITAAFLSLLILATSSAPASAVVSRPLLRTIDTVNQAAAVTTDSAGNVYVEDERSGGGALRIQKFDPAGNPLNFTGLAGYINANKLTGSPLGSFLDESGYALSGGLAVDDSGGPTDGYVYATAFYQQGGGTYVFDSSGIYKGFVQALPHSGNAKAYTCGLAIKPASNQFYMTSRSFSGFLGESALIIPSDGDPANDLISRRLKFDNAYFEACTTAVDSAGAIYLGSLESDKVTKYDESQLDVGSPVGTAIYPHRATALAIDPFDDLFVNDGNHIVEYSPGGVVVSEFGILDESVGVTAGPGNIVYASQGDEIQVFGPPTLLVPKVTTEDSSGLLPNAATVAGEVDPDGTSVVGCEFKYGTDKTYSAGSMPCSAALPITSPETVSAPLTGLNPETTYHYRLFAESADGVAGGLDQTFTTPPSVEAVATGDATEIAKTTAKLNGSFSGRGDDNHYYFEYGTDTTYGQTAPVPPGDDAGSASGPREVTPITISGLKGGTEYHYRLVVANIYGESRGGDRTFVTSPAIANLTTDPVTGLTDSSADLHGSFEADAYPVHYYFEYGQTASYGSSLPVPPGSEAGSGPGVVNVAPVHITGLQPGANYHYRIVASNALGKTFGQDVVFKTASPPVISGLSTVNVTATSATLKGEVNPDGGATSYRFEWGTTTGYGKAVPVPDAGVGSGTIPIPVSVQLSGLESGVTYHFRLTAENAYGKDVSSDQTFGFYPSACPNAQIRQETGSSHVPDCRGYEIASPSYAGGTLLIPSLGPTTPYATNPARVSFSGYFGSVPGAGNTSGQGGELYVSTRTDTGWFTKYVGRSSTETFSTGGPPITFVNSAEGVPRRMAVGMQASPSMDRVASYDRGYASGFSSLKVPSSNAPYIWNTSTAALVERWPTNLQSVPGGEGFTGVPKASADFSHFIFSSNVVFAPGGEATPAVPPNDEKCCSASIYDNNVKSGEVHLASIKEGNVAFKGSVLNVSEDGSHILMVEHGDIPGNFENFSCRLNAGCWANPQEGLYLRVDDRQTYEIARGHKVRYAGSTADGETVYLTSTEQLTGDDTDASSDLFVWHESDPGSLTRVSKGSGSSGNSDGCSVAWTQYCGVWSISFSEQGATGILGNGQSDSPIAGDSGDIYFESPEQLDGGKGEPNQVNLYVYRDEAVQYVATLKEDRFCLDLGYDAYCSDNPVVRMQVTRDGSRVAFVTLSKLTSYDNAGKSEMYTFDPATSKINCVSCSPNNQAPTSEVYASQNGLFMTEDGRTFFSTADPLVPRDTNEGEDVYEYTEGKAQLISAGIGKVNTGYSAASINSRLGLVGVSANGTDVYFATSDNLVTQDHNGPELKVYDARTGGGFPADVSPLKCEAADECHGAVGGPPGLPADRTSASLGKAPKRHAAHRKKKRGGKHSKKHAKKSRKHAKKAEQQKSGARKGGDHRG